MRVSSTFFSLSLFSAAVVVVVVVVVVGSADAPCAAGCQCYSHYPHYNVICSRKKLRSVPSLNALKTVKEKLLVQFDFNYIRQVTSVNLPSGLRVKMLNLRHNPVNISSTAFANIASTLEILDLSYTESQFTDLQFLEGLNELSMLMLTGNQQKVTALRSGMFASFGLSKLNDLRLKDCNLDDVQDGAFDGLENLMRLELSDNHLSRVPPALKRLTKLDTLILKSNKIASIPTGAFSALTRLKMLDMDYNANISVTDGSVDGITDSLEILSMNDCQMDDFPRAFEELKNLKKLLLKGNDLNKMYSLNGQFCLEYVDVSYSSYKISDYTFYSQGKCLKTVIINKRQFTAVPTYCLSFLKVVEELHLKENLITVLQYGAFGNIPVKKIALSSNPLSRVDQGAFVGLYSGLTVIFDTTHMTTLDFIMQYKWGTFEEMSFYSARLVCTCELFKAVLFMRPKYIRGTCDEPDGEKLYLEGGKYRIFMKRDCSKVRKPPGGSASLRMPTTRKTTPTVRTPWPTRQWTTPATATTTTTTTTTTSTTTTTTTTPKPTTTTTTTSKPTTTPATTTTSTTTSKPTTTPATTTTSTTTSKPTTSTTTSKPTKTSTTTSKPTTSTTTTTTSTTTSKPTITPTTTSKPTTTSTTTSKPTTTSTTTSKPTITPTTTSKPTTSTTTSKPTITPTTTYKPTTTSTTTSKPNTTPTTTTTTTTPTASTTPTTTPKPTTTSTTTTTTPKPTTTITATSKLTITPTTTTPNITTTTATTSKATTPTTTITATATTPKPTTAPTSTTATTTTATNITATTTAASITAEATEVTMSETTEVGSAEEMTTAEDYYIVGVPPILADDYGFELDDSEPPSEKTDSEFSAQNILILIIAFILIIIGSVLYISYYRWQVKRLAAERERRIRATIERVHRRKSDNLESGETNVGFDTPSVQMDQSIGNPSVDYQPNDSENTSQATRL